MLLQKLQEYSQRVQLPPTGYIKRRIRWVVDLDTAGKLAGVVSLDVGESKAKGKRLLVPDVGNRASNIVAALLVDTAEYALGMPRDGKTQARHEAFSRLVTKCADDTNDSAVMVVARFLNDFQWPLAATPKEMKPADWAAFRVNGVYPVDQPSVRQWWATEFWRRALEEGDDEEEPTQPEAHSVSEGESQCLVCGRMAPPVLRHPFKLRGIPGGKPSGNALVSANIPSALSYGRSASAISPCCQECVEAYAKAYEDLRSRPESTLVIGPSRYIFWTRQPSSFNPASLLSAPRPEDVKALLESALRGREPQPLEGDAFYATALSASGGRVVVREWLKTTVGEARRHLARYFASQRIVDGDGTEGHPLGLYALAASTVADPRRDLPPNTPKVLLRMALAGGPLPRWLLFQVVRRNRAEQRVTRPRAALIKMVCLSNRDVLKEDEMVQLDIDNRDPAYLCGRLLAVAGSAQWAALRLEAVVDRFYGTASSAPASVFPHLLRGVRHHLARLRRDRPPACHALEARLEEVTSGLKRFPKVLTLEEQGLFALGFYHQRAADRAAAAAHRQAETGVPEPETE